jgi:hypothetical protein
MKTHHCIIPAFLFFLPAFAFAQGSQPLPELGINASLRGKPVLPADDAWNRDISGAPVDPHSDAIIDSIGKSKPLHPDFGTTWQGNPNGIPYIVVSGNQPKTRVTFTDYADESDPGPYPIPANAPVEGGFQSDGDRHLIVLDRDHWLLYEMWHAAPVDGGKTWKAANGAVFDLNRKTPQRPAGWTSADAAGLPIFPGLVRYDEVTGARCIAHALRFTVSKSRRAFIPPATHFASRSTDTSLPPMGMRVRLKAGFDISGFPDSVKVILIALKKYGMIVADNGGDWFLSGAPDPRWSDDELHTLSRVKGADFEVVRMDGLTAR